jgi:hypothetical protein
VTKTCVFCNRGRVTDEHILAQWISGLFPNATLGISHLGALGGDVKRYQLAFLNQVVGCVCKRCNNGWMSGIEGSVKPTLAPMLTTNLSIPLSPENQKLLSTWVFKTVLMFQYLNPRFQPIPKSEYDRFYAIKEPPENCVMWIARRGVIEQDDSYPPPNELVAVSAISCLDAVKLKASEADEWVNAAPTSGTIVAATFAVARVAFQLLWHDVPETLSIRRTATRDVTRCIWPAQERNAVWPPPAGIEKIGGFYAFHGTLLPSEPTQR